MALETATHINDLVITNPDGLDDLSQGDNHLRMLKDVLKRDLPLDAPATTLGMNILKSAVYDAVLALLSASNSPYRNRVINGDFKLDTRNNGSAATVINGDGNLTYTADSWFAWCSGGADMQITRSISGGTGQPRLSISSTSGAGAWNFGTRLNRADVRDFSSPTVSKVITLSVDMITPINITWTLYGPNLTPGTYGTIGSPTKTAVATGVFTAGTGVYSTQITLPVNGSIRGLEIIFSAGGLTSVQTVTFYKVQLEQHAISTANIVFESVDEPLQRLRAGYYCRKISATARFPAAAASQLSDATINWNEMYTTPSGTLVTSGASANASSKTLVVTSAFGGRFEIQSTAAGDCYALDNVYLLQAEIT